MDLNNSERTMDVEFVDGDGDMAGSWWCDDLVMGEWMDHGMPIDWLINWLRNWQNWLQTKRAASSSTIDKAEGIQRTTNPPLTVALWYWDNSTWGPRWHNNPA